MEYVLYAIFFISWLALVATVLLQPGKTDAGALFTSNISSNAFGPRGTQTVLSKITIVAAATFMLSALMLSMPALTGNVSVLQSNPETPATEQSTTTDSNTNSSANTVNAAPSPAAASDANTVSNTATNAPANK